MSQYIEIVMHNFNEGRLLIRKNTVASLFKMGKEFASRGSEFFPLRAVPYGIENTISTIGSFP